MPVYLFRFTSIFLLISCALFPMLVRSTTMLPVISHNGMVVSSQHYATDVGAKILQQGGNAIDAAVAVGYALAVTDPCCGNIGGGGFMLIRFANGKTTFINFREMAPAASNPTLFKDQSGNLLTQALDQGYLPVGVPGTVMGLNYALTKYGSLPLNKIMSPAIQLAQSGYILQAGDIDILQQKTKYFQNEPNIADIFLKNNQPLRIGDRLKQENLANTLRLIAKGGTKEFYQGTIAKKLIAASQQQGGIMTLQDLAHYKVEEFKPLTCHYRNYQVITAPPPSSGGVTLCEILNITEAYPLAQYGYHSVLGTHYILEAMRYAYADRNHYLGDPNFVNNPTQKLLSAEHAKDIRQQISSDKANNSASIQVNVNQTTAGNHTTHYSIVDKYGNAVAVTYTLNSYFGAKVIPGDLGFFLNDELDDFALKPGTPNKFQLVQGETNAIQSYKRPLSSMTPTILLKNNQLYMVVGTPGGSTIITQVLQTIENVIDYGMNLQSAVNAPRFHMQWLPDIVYVEPQTFTSETTQKLEQMGYHFKAGSPFQTPTWGAVAAILYDDKNQTLYGAIDKRRPAGSAVGLN